MQLNGVAPMQLKEVAPMRLSNFSGTHALLTEVAPMQL